MMISPDRHPVASCDHCRAGCASWLDRVQGLPTRPSPYTPWCCCSVPPTTIRDHEQRHNRHDDDLDHHNHATTATAPSTIPSRFRPEPQHSATPRADWEVFDRRGPHHNHSPTNPLTRSATVKNRSRPSGLAVCSAPADSQSGTQSRSKSTHHRHARRATAKGRVSSEST